MKSARLVAMLFLLVVAHAAQAGGQITIAAAADLKFAMDEIVSLFGKAHPAERVATVYGSSGKFHTQIRQGAPYDLYFSADIAYPRALEADGFAASGVQAYALGRIVLWRASRTVKALSLNDLADPAIQRIAIANPRHAPYGKRAEEALRAAAVWDKVEAKLVYGENVAQTAQFVQTGNAQIGLIALSLALSPELSSQGSYTLIPDSLHQPLEQGFVITKRAADNPLAQDFSRFMRSPEVRAIMMRHGFVLPGKTR
ncbi:MAG: molybdate ABC transporter substrate-binding protein [Gallionella sp.]|nr:molybdate ABC transporter substrate-binding protein [Gallionella sp.]